ncbi:hypothetical protein D3C84_1061950 [compost metagenome]
MQHVVGARWHLEAGLQLAVDQLAAAVVQAVVVTVEGQHLVVLLAMHLPPLLAVPWPGENDRSGHKGIDVANLLWPAGPSQARKRLGGCPLQRWKAWRKLAVSL